jgi:hypothetical protein
MKVTPIAAVLFAIVSVVTASWEDAAKAACQRVGRTFDDRFQVMKKQCTVMCRASGELPKFENLEDGTECEIIGFSRKAGSCKEGKCQ